MIWLLMDWSHVDYLCIIVMFLSAVWTLILTAPIHCRGSNMFWWRKWKWRDIRPSMVTHTRNLCSAFNPSIVHTHSSEHTHTVNTHPEQWVAIYAAAPGEQLGVRCLAQGHLSHGIEGGESAVHSLPPPTIPAGRDSNRKKPICILDGLRVSQFSAYFHFWVNYSWLHFFSELCFMEKRIILQVSEKTRILEICKSFILFGCEMLNDINRQGEDNGGVSFCCDGA